MRISLEVPKRSLPKDGSAVDEIILCLDEAGAKQLAEILTRDFKPHNHVHMMTESWGGFSVELSEDTWEEGASIIHHLKIEFVPSAEGNDESSQA